MAKDVERTCNTCPCLNSSDKPWKFGHFVTIFLSAFVSSFLSLFVGSRWCAPKVIVSSYFFESEPWDSCIIIAMRLGLGCRESVKNYSAGLKLQVSTLFIIKCKLYGLFCSLKTLVTLYEPRVGSVTEFDELTSTRTMAGWISYALMHEFVQVGPYAPPSATFFWASSWNLSAFNLAAFRSSPSIISFDTFSISSWLAVTSFLGILRPTWAVSVMKLCTDYAALKKLSTDCQCAVEEQRCGSWSFRLFKKLVALTSWLA